MNGSDAMVVNLTYDAWAPRVPEGTMESGFAARRAGTDRARRAPRPDFGFGDHERWMVAASVRGRANGPTLGDPSIATKERATKKPGAPTPDFLKALLVVWRCVEAFLMSAPRLDRRQTA